MAKNRRANPFVQDQASESEEGKAGADDVSEEDEYEHGSFVVSDAAVSSSMPAELAESDDGAEQVMSRRVRRAVVSDEDDAADAGDDAAAPGADVVPLPSAMPQADQALAPEQAAPPTAAAGRHAVPPLSDSEARTCPTAEGLLQPDMTVNRLKQILKVSVRMLKQSF